MAFDTSASKLFLSELFEFTLKDGTILRYTTYGQPITYLTNVYTNAPLTRTPHTQDSDLSVGQTRVLFPRVSPWLDPTKLLNRYLDNAGIKITWIDRTDHNNSRVVFVGDSGNVNYNQLTCEVVFKNLLNLFHKKIPRRRYTEGCGHTMYDDDCKLIRALFEVTGSAEAGSTKGIINDSTRAEADNYFDLGIIEFTSGLNNGVKRWVKRYTVGVIELFIDLIFTPQVGDTYKIVPHCKKTYTSCKVDYSNELNYGGFQDIPDPTDTLT